jgi:hypothetical protein
VSSTGHSCRLVAMNPTLSRHLDSALASLPWTVAGQPWIDELEA